MKKKLCAAILALVLMALASASAAPNLGAGLMASAKQALVSLAAGDYERVSALLPFSGTAPDATEWASFARNFSSLKNVQTQYAVAYWKNGWRVAVPVQAPQSGSVEALMLLSSDGAAFDGYKYVTWSQVEKDYASSEKILWDQEYVGGAAMVFN